MNPCELTASITAIANTLACNMTNDQLSVLGSSLTQLADTLFTIAAQRSISQSKEYLGITDSSNQQMQASTEKLPPSPPR